MHELPAQGWGSGRVRVSVRARVGAGVRVRVRAGVGVRVGVRVGVGARVSFRLLPALVEATEQAGDEDEGEEGRRDPERHVHVSLEVGAHDGRQLEDRLLGTVGRRLRGLRQGTW